MKSTIAPLLQTVDVASPSSPVFVFEIAVKLLFCLCSLRCIASILFLSSRYARSGSNVSIDLVAEASKDIDTAAMPAPPLSAHPGPQPPPTSPVRRVLQRTPRIPTKPHAGRRSCLIYGRRNRVASARGVALAPCTSVLSSLCLVCLGLGFCCFLILVCVELCNS